ncbi:MAG: hypothetical protein II007_11810 [Gammaproteobacteria bacterium]|nr:hypothetical protein [Gammaproteobacteria bacterium]
MANTARLLTVALLLLAPLATAKQVYLCNDNQFQDHPCADGGSTKVAVDKLATGEPAVIEPLPDLAPASPSVRDGHPVVDQRPERCRNLTDRERSAIREAIRFWRVVPCMTSEQAARSIGSREVTIYELGGPPGDEQTEWVITPVPRLPNRIIIQRGMVVATH